MKVIQILSLSLPHETIKTIYDNILSNSCLPRDALPKITGQHINDKAFDED